MNTAITDKLAKLLRHAESAKAIGSIAEAEAFAAQAQKLLTQHGLSMSDIEIEQEQAEAEQPEQTYHKADTFGEKRKRTAIIWQVDLMGYISRANNCKSLMIEGSNTQVLVGFKSDKEVCIALFAYFVHLAQDVCNRAFKDHQRTEEYTEAREAAERNYWGSTSGTLAGYSRAWKKSFLKGFVSAVGNRLVEAKRAAVQEVEQTQGQTAGLVHLRDREAIVKHAVEKMKFGTYRGGNSGRHDHGAFQAGQRAGGSVSLGGKALGAGSGGGQQLR